MHKQRAARELLRSQRSHVLFVLSASTPDGQQRFLRWYQDRYRLRIANVPGILSVQHYVQHDVDITQGQFERLPLPYLGVYELCLDGAPEAQDLITEISRLHREEESARLPATWLYYPVSEPVGRPPISRPSLLTLAFANALSGREDEFREWYATRHIRHALHIDALVSGQCFERTQFQDPGALEARFQTIAVYEQEGSPESIIESMRFLPEELFPFPMIDLSRFAESVYRPL